MITGKFWGKWLQKNFCGELSETNFKANFWENCPASYNFIYNNRANMEEIKEKF